MKTSNEYLDAAKTVLHIDSDRALAMHFGWNRGTPQAIRGRTKYLNNDEAANVADVLNINPLVVIADVQTEKAGDEKHRVYWANIAKKFAGIAASVLFISSMTMTSNESYSMKNSIDSLYYVK